VHRRVFPGGTQITTDQPIPEKNAEMYKYGLLLKIARSSRPTSGVPLAVQVLLTLPIICSPCSPGSLCSQKNITMLLHTNLKSQAEVSRSNNSTRHNIKMSCRVELLLLRCTWWV